MKLITLLICMLAAGTSTMNAQHAATEFLKRNILQPPMLVFEPETDYDAATQNWAAHQLDDGRMLFTNSRGLLLYDGTGVQVIFAEKILRDFTVGPDGEIYITGSGIFGRLEAENGHWQFVDLSENLPEPAQNQMIWQAVTFDDAIYLRLRNGFVRYADGQAGFTHFHPDGENWLSGNFKVFDDRLFTVVDTRDLYEIRHDSLHFLHRISEARNPSILIVPDPHRTDAAGNPSLLLNSGETFVSYYPHDDRIVPVDVSTDFLETVLQYRPYKSHRMPNGYLALATVNNGVFILDESFRTMLHLNTDSGLPSNTILNVFTDRENGLWLTTGNGLVRLDFYYPYWKSIRDDAFKGSVYQTIFYEGDLIVTTSESIYLVSDGQITLLEANTSTGFYNSVAHSWIQLPGEDHKEIVLEIGSRYLAAVDGEQLNVIDFPTLQNPRIEWLATDPNQPDLLISAGPQLVAYHKLERNQDGELTISHEGILFSGDHVYQDPFVDELGSLWFRSNSDGYRRIFSGGTDRSIYDIPEENEIQYFNGSNENLPKLDSRIQIGQNMGFAVDRSSDYFLLKKQRPAHERYLPDDLEPRTFPEAPFYLSNPLTVADAVYYSTEYENFKGITKIYQDGTLEIPAVWNAYGPSYTNNQGGSVLEDDLLAASTHGLVAWMPELEPWYQLQKSFTPLLQSIEIMQDSLFYSGAPLSSADTPAFDYDRNQIRFTMAPGTLMFPGGDALYQSRLLPFDENWSDWTPRNDRTFTSLPPGIYRFEVRSKNNLGVISETLQYEFTISTPFYRSVWALLLYLGGLGLTITITSRKMADYRNKRTKEKMLAEQAEELEKINTLRSRLFTNIAHDLRTPITLMDAPVQNVLQKFSLPEEATNYLNLSVRSAGRIKQLVEQILDLNRLEAGSLKLFVTEIDLNAKLRMLAAAFESLAEYHKLELKSNLPDHPVMVFGDDDKLEKVITNLIANAIKFCDEGDVIEISLTETDQSVSFMVRDSGIGIAEDKLPHIFDPYISAGNENAEYRESMGIGLTITKEYVHLHHGEISVESKKDEFTTFSVLLPKGSAHFSDDQIMMDEKADLAGDDELAQAEKQHVKHLPPQKENAEQPLAHILLVEDNREMADYVQSLLEDNSYRVSRVINGKKALEWLEKESPDLVISDVMMPVMDGLELLKQIKQNDQLRLIPIIFLSAKTDLEGRMESFSLGVNDYIHKPFASDELLVRIANLLEYSENRKNAAIEYEETEGAKEKSESISSSADEKHVLIRQLVESHISEGNFSLDAIAPEVAMSKSTLYRYIKKETGLSAGNYIKEVRLQKAREYLEAKKVKTVKEASMAVGYNHSGYFSKQFYERFGKKVSDLL